MPKTVNDLIQHVKKSCDSDTLLFHFKGSSKGEAFFRPILHQPWYQEDTDGNDITTNDNTYYQRVIMARITNEMTLNVFYKNNNGVWVDYRKCIQSYPNIAIQVSAVLYEEYVKINIDYIPPCTFMDSNHCIHYIDEHDGLDNFNHLPPIEIDTSKKSILSYRPYSLEDPYLPFEARHVMQDLRVKTFGFPSSTLLVWLNGVFVPIIPDETYEDTFYIKNAMTVIGSKCINQKLNSPWDYKNNKNATVIEDSTFNEYRLDARFRFFSWKGVKVSRWYAPLSIDKTPIFHNYSNINIIKTIIFPEPINKNAHMILDNGILLSPDEYIIDSEDPRKVTLKNVESNAYGLLYEIIKDVRENAEIYAGIKPLALIEPTIVNRDYSLINFSKTEDDGKTLYLKRSFACATNFPYKNEITFSDIDLGDLVTINGTFNEYEWVHNHTIFYPKFRFTFNGDESRISEEEVVRYYFISK
jgi:hypothetical protein